jgi:hypothetical protein
VKWRIEVKMGRHLAEKVLWMMYMTVFWSGSRSILELICPFAYLAPLQASLIRRISDCRNRTMNLVGMQVTNCKGKISLKERKNKVRLNWFLGLFCIGIWLQSNISYRFPSMYSYESNADTVQIPIRIGIL